jgi:hypothetical protein
MTTLQRKGDHCKTREFPLGEVVTFIILLAAAIGIIVGLSALTSSQAAQASTTSYLSPAVTAARSIAPQCGDRMNTPIVITWVPFGQAVADQFTCTDSPAIITTTASLFRKGHPGTWGAVLAHCKRARDCHKVPVAIRHDLGIRKGQTALIEYGDTSYIWVRKGCNGVRTFNS